MKLRFLIGSILVALLGWIAFKDSAWTAWLNRGEPHAAPSPDYATQAGWLIRPQSQPPAVWDSNWAIDVFMLPPRPGQGRAAGMIATDDANLRQHLAARAEGLADPLARIGPVYVPHLRQPAAASRQPDWSAAQRDLATAFSAYLENDNRGRAVLFAVPPGSEQLLPALGESLIGAPPALGERTVGLVHFSDALQVEPPAMLCGPAVAGDCIVEIPVSARFDWKDFLSPNLPNASPEHEIISPMTARAALTVRRDSILAWLDRNGARPAEPLDSFETIGVAPIRRPGTQAAPDIRGREG